MSSHLLDVVRTAVGAALGRADEAVLWYFLALNTFYLLLLALSAPELWRHVRLSAEEHLPALLGTEMLPPLSIIAPAYNEEVTIVASVLSFLTLEYPRHEVIFVNDGSKDGTMARLPDLQLFAAEHGLKIGTIADLIEYRSQSESLVEKIGQRPLTTAYGDFIAHAWRDKPSQGVHLALVRGSWSADDAVPAHVRQDQGPVADPRVAPHRDPRPRPRLLADGHVKPLDAVLAAAVHHRHVRAEQHVVLQGHVAQAAERADVDAAADLGGGVREDRAETQAGVGVATGQYQTVERPPQVDAGQPGEEAERLRPPRERLFRAQRQPAEPVEQEGRQDQLPQQAELLAQRCGRLLDRRRRRLGARQQQQ